MFKKLLGKFINDNKAVTASLVPLYAIKAEGFVFPFSLADTQDNWLITSCLEQLHEEDYVSHWSDCWFISWDDFYRILNNEDYASSLAIFSFPQQRNLTAHLAATGSISDDTFRVFIDKWTLPDDYRPVEITSQGASFSSPEGTFVLSEENWQLLDSLQQLRLQQRQTPGETVNQTGWAKIRRQAKKAGAKLDDYLAKTIVIRPESLQLKLRKSLVADTRVLEIEPVFDEQPAKWLQSFDRTQQVQDRYRVLGDDGELSHVILSPEVKDVLTSVHAITGRRVAGDDALSFVRNPYTWIGEDASQVLDPEVYEQNLQDAGIYFYDFRLEPRVEENMQVESVSLILIPRTEQPVPDETYVFNRPIELAALITELEQKLAAHLPAGVWQGYDLELSRFTQDELQEYQALLEGWQQQAAGLNFSHVLDLNKYSDRVIGIGEFEKISSPYLVKSESENWLPDNLVKEMYEAMFSGWDLDNHQHFHELETRLEDAKASDAPEVAMPWNDNLLPREEAEVFHEKWKKKIDAETSITANTEPVSRAVLLIEQNIEQALYVKQRRTSLLEAHLAEAELPMILKDSIQLREHQCKGVAWLQQLYLKSPTETTGCLLADDMGLGKTLQILTFLIWHRERFPDAPPSLIVAPVSLLDNWEREVGNFFLREQVSILKLYGNELREKKCAKESIPFELKSKGIKNLLQNDWVGEAQIVLTTYETLRDQEFSLARQPWSIMVCDEAQKIKNPAALITQSAKAIQAQFKVACTGTPVENTLVDLWCLFDFVQPGLLGALNNFGKDFLRPIEQQSDDKVLESLRKLIEPQTLRRTKEEVAKDLPEKIEDKSCKHLSMLPLQRDLYTHSVVSWQNQQEISEGLAQRGAGMLGLLHRLKLICAWPYSVSADLRLRNDAPKVKWLLDTLNNIRQSSDDKVIIFTELRDIQRELQHLVSQHFGFKPFIINGDTSTKSGSDQNRQSLIDNFQSSPGFNVIILSTIAVGFGVNVQKANHVIHFTRCWNPAKEDQATDRAYRIGQQKDVYVYYPTVRDSQLMTFEETLDELLNRRRALARDMLKASTDLTAADFEAVLTRANTN
ncbi:DEAD/DEAH box helicase [Enterobacter roggenkampii]|uniref:type I Zorya anti-phage system protein ZorD n=1 Tax=Enterobacter roggenkampii TaxID=1812935 RepID=UPI00240E0C2D|nr:type I Zorya anti-phage system protein ZorD [Enterobacter roggenkampii]WFC86305.1 DEAD/DEAH box helicase [Enterobacter roggenkampii]